MTYAGEVYNLRIKHWPHNKFQIRCLASLVSLPKSREKWWSGGLQKRDAVPRELGALINLKRIY